MFRPILRVKRTSVDQIDDKEENRVDSSKDWTEPGKVILEDVKESKPLSDDFPKPDMDSSQFISVTSQNRHLMI